MRCTSYVYGAVWRDTPYGRVMVYDEKPGRPCGTCPACRMNALQRRIDAALALHTMNEYRAGMWECLCCEEDWPCETVQALTGEPS